MRKFLPSLFVLVAALLAAPFISDDVLAQAQTTFYNRTWVSGTGDDAAACSRTAPCKTFQGAINKTAVNGEINCLDAGGFDTVNISKSVTIDCTGVYGSIIHPNNTGFYIAFDNFASSDTRKTVSIRGASVNGLGVGLYGIWINGDAGGGHVVIQDVTIEGNGLYDSGAGIYENRKSGILTVQNTTIRNMTGSGINIKPSGGIIRATLNNVTVTNSNAGFLSSSGAAIMIRNSVFTDNATVGILVGPSSQALIENSTIDHNGTGISSPGLTRLSGNSIFLNANAAVSGTVQSYSDNKFVGAIGGTIMPIGSTSNPSGLQ